MELAAGISHREDRLDLLASHLAAFDPDREEARERLDRAIGADLAMLLVTALSHTPEHAVAA